MMTISAGLLDGIKGPFVLNPLPQLIRTVSFMTSINVSPKSPPAQLPAWALFATHPRVAASQTPTRMISEEDPEGEAAGALVPAPAHSPAELVPHSLVLLLRLMRAEFHAQAEAGAASSRAT